MSKESILNKHDVSMMPPVDEREGETAVSPPSTVEIAGQWTLIWWRFRRHKLAMVGGLATAFIYFVAIFAEFLAPALPVTTYSDYTFAPPQRLHFFLQTEDGTEFKMHVYGYQVEIEPEALRRVFTIDESWVIPVSFFVRGESYEMWDLFSLDRHLIGPENPEDPFYPFGADRLGRDVLSRLIYGTRVSMSIGLVGVMLSLILGVLLGGVSGYYGGRVDNVIQRAIEMIRSIPQIPLWMALAAALPLTLDPILRYFLIVVVLSVIGWTGLARVVRGRFLTLKTEDFVMAAKLDGVSEWRIITRHMVPSFSSHLIASVTLAIPGMILAETALSFLGLGLKPPTISWGVLMQEAQNVRSVATAPWLLIPGLTVVFAILALNFLGDGLRDAADPYEVV